MTCGRDRGVTFTLVEKLEETFTRGLEDADEDAEGVFCAPGESKGEVWVGDIIAAKVLIPWFGGRPKEGNWV